MFSVDDNGKITKPEAETRKITDEEWQIIEKQLDRPYGAITLKLQNKIVYFGVGRIGSGINYKIIVTMQCENDKDKCKWISGNEKNTDDFEKKICYKSGSYLHKTKDRKNKKFRATAKKYGIDPDRKIVYYSGLWGSAKALVKQLRKNFKDEEISIVES